MKSKELIEIFNKTRRTPNISLTPEQVEELIKDLEELEKYRNVMCKPIVELMKDLEKLEYIKALIPLYNNDEIHFTRGFDFINRVKEVINNDK